MRPARIARPTTSIPASKHPQAAHCGYHHRGTARPTRAHDTGAADLPGRANRRGLVRENREHGPASRSQILTAGAAANAIPSRRLGARRRNLGSVSHPGAPVPAAGKQIRLRYADTCRACGTALAAGTQAIYDPASRTVRCSRCPTASTAPAAVDAAPAPGTAGASARREYERRKAARERQVQARYPRLGRLILAISDQPRSTRAWATGAAGEVRLGARLDQLTNPAARVLHDRRIPGTRANIDHIVVCRAGLLVIDAKRYSGRPHLRTDGGLWRERTEKLMVGTRDHTALVDGVLRQVGLVKSALGDDAVPVRGFLCFIDADWPLTAREFTIRGVTVFWPKKLAALITGPGPLSEASIAAAHQHLARAFPSA